MSKDPIAAAAEIVADKANPKRHKCPPPRPWWLPARFATCTCVIVTNSPIIVLRGNMTTSKGTVMLSGAPLLLAHGRVTTDCCRRHGSAK